MQRLKKNAHLIFWSVIIVFLLGLTLISYRPDLLEYIRPKPKIEPPPELQTAYAPLKWWSSAYSFPTEVIYTMPAAYRIDEEGIYFTSGQLDVTADEIKTSFDQWCQINNDQKINHAEVAGYGDWNVELKVKSETDDWKLHLVQAAPIAYMTNFNQALQLRCPEAKFTLVEQGVLIKYSDRTLLIQAQAASQVTLINLDQAKLDSPDNIFRLAVLPNSEESTVEQFVNTPWTLTYHTQVDWRQTSKGLETYYTWFTEGDQTTLVGVLPHHLTHLQNPPAVIAEFDTHLGKLSLVDTNQLLTLQPIPEITTLDQPVENPDHQQLIIKQLLHEVSEYDATPAATQAELSNQITWLTNVTQLAQLTQLYQLEEQEQLLLTKLQQTIEATDPNLFVSTDSGQLNQQLNLTAAWLGAATQVVNQFPDSLAKLKPLISEQINFLTQQDRTQHEQPFLPAFSPYLGMTQATANHILPYGQALHLWYNLAEWAEATKDSNLQLAAKWVLAQQQTASLSYWFGIPVGLAESYQHPMISDLEVQSAKFDIENPDLLQTYTQTWSPMWLTLPLLKPSLTDSYWQVISKTQTLNPRSDFQDAASLVLKNTSFEQTLPNKSKSLLLHLYYLPD